MAYVKFASRRYFFEILAASVVYLVALRLRFLALHAAINPVLLFGAKLLPLLSILLMAVAAWRFYTARDELQSLLMLKITAASFLLAVFAFMALPSFYLLGLPVPPPRTPLGLIVMIGSFFLCSIVFSFLRQKQESGRTHAMVRLTLAIVTVLVIPAAWWLAITYLPVPPTPFWRGIVWLAIGGGIWLTTYQLFFRRYDQ